MNVMTLTHNTAPLSRSPASQENRRVTSGRMVVSAISSSGPSDKSKRSHRSFHSFYNESLTVCGHRSLSSSTPPCTSSQDATVARRQGDHSAIMSKRKHHTRNQNSNERYVETVGLHQQQAMHTSRIQVERIPHRMNQRAAPHMFLGNNSNDIMRIPRDMNTLNRINRSCEEEPLQRLHSREHFRAEMKRRKMSCDFIKPPKHQ